MKMNEVFIGKERILLPITYMHVNCSFQNWGTLKYIRFAYNAGPEAKFAA